MVTALTATEISMLQDKMLIEYTPTIDGGLMKKQKIGYTDGRHQENIHINTNSILSLNDGLFVNLI